MTELIQNAWLGWQAYKESGRLIALFLLILLTLWLWKTGQERSFRFYAAVLAVLCICPVTAALLMQYQTRFYDYQWIWSYVPVTIVTAWGTVLVADRIRSVYLGRERYKAYGLFVLLAAVFLLCGNFGKASGQWAEERADRGSAVQILTAVTESIATSENSHSEALCILGPRNVIAEARRLDGRIRTVYGRDMWDLHLGAYSYDVYDDGTQQLYEWMNAVEASAGDGEALAAALEVPGNEIRKSGANCLIMPADVPEELVQAIEEELQVSAVFAPGCVYYRISGEGGDQNE